ncbi:MAG: hypothetical protein IIC09_01405 [Proteobacteria bacterium]|nr:hypothetical protein [Pseudomonadota bacterium]
MKNISISVFALSAVLAAGSAFAGSCPKHMKAIDAELAKMPSLSTEAMSQVKELRANGGKLHKSGSHLDSVKALLEARNLLGI